jgi:hypothetical protein
MLLKKKMLRKTDFKEHLLFASCQHWVSSEEGRSCAHINIYSKKHLLLSSSIAHKAFQSAC